MTEPLTVDRCRTAVGEPFALDAGDGRTVELVLAEARGLGRAFEEREAFVLLFHGPEEPPLPQATYRLTSGRLGAQEIFIVPVGRTAAGGYEYEANFP